jgi:hypothetical protein
MGSFEELDRFASTLRSWTPASPLVVFVPPWMLRSLRRASMTKRQLRRWRGRAKADRRRGLAA